MPQARAKLGISFNSPVVLWFSILCLTALILNMATKGTANHLAFSVYRASLADPFTYVRFFGHILGHADWAHFIGNITLILVIGPLLEEKYGSSNLLFMMATTALVTGLVHFTLFPQVQLLGASGVVFAFILLSSFTSIKAGYIPLSFLLISVIYIGGEVYNGLFVRDNVANLTHILGGFVGAGLGYVMHKHKMNRY